jgi:CheY-like chemotaxis protein
MFLVCADRRSAHVIARGEEWALRHSAIADAPLDAPCSRVQASEMGKTVLLVDDDLVLRDILQDVLEYEGYNVIPAADGRQALDYLRTNGGDGAPALMILDLMMPLVNGWQVLDAIQDDPSLHVPVIVVSASAPVQSAGTTYLHKPFNLLELVDTVHQRC